MLGYGMGLGHFLINQTKRLFLDAVILKRVEGVFQVSVSVGKRTRRDLLGVGNKGRRLATNRKYEREISLGRGGALRRLIIWLFPVDRNFCRKYVFRRAHLSSSVRSVCNIYTRLDNVL